MYTNELAHALSRIFAELTAGTPPRGGFVLNAGDRGLLASIDALSAREASLSSADGACLAAHAAHLAYGLSLMNGWAAKGDNPFAGARWDEAWRIGEVNEARWQSIRDELRKEVQQWEQVLAMPRIVEAIALKGMVGSVVHLAYHMGAMRQIVAAARGPKDPLST